MSTHVLCKEEKKALIQRQGSSGRPRQVGDATLFFSSSFLDAPLDFYSIC